MGTIQGFRGEVAVVTGAGGGIGRALAHDLARAGAVLALSDRDATRVEETAVRCRELGADAGATALDVRERDAVEAHAAAVEERHGRVDLVINNAGVAFGAHVADQRIADVTAVLDVNLRGVVHGTQAFLPALARAPAGRLVNLSSLFGLVPMAWHSAYAASKFGVCGYTEALAMDLAVTRSPVSATCVHPGGVATDIAASARTTPGEEWMAEAFERVLRMPAEDAARIILRGVARRRPRVLVGADARALHLAQGLLGARYPTAVVALLRPLLARYGTRAIPDAPAAARASGRGERMRA